EVEVGGGAAGERELDEVDMSDLSPEEQWRVEHARMHAKHRGHEAMHAEMVLILIATLVVAQLLLVQWKQRHPRSYNDQTRRCHGLWHLPSLLWPLLWSSGTGLCRNVCRLHGIYHRVLQRVGHAYQTSFRQRVCCVWAADLCGRQ
ncbi:RNF121 isoform 7, partial [Pan troglodytes]